MQNSAVYDHPAGPFTIVETHISWVILTGPFAYKIKKPVNLGFLDFSTLEQRRFYCEEEIRVNKRLCPQIYAGAVPITGAPDHPFVNGSGVPFEYAVKMKQFDENLLWDRLLEKGKLKPEAMDQLASLIADFHTQAPHAPPESVYGLPATFWRTVKANLDHIDRTIRDSSDRAVFQQVSGWMKENYRLLSTRIEQRRADGFVRELHGDLHLRNIAFISHEQPDILVFDAIEFDAHLRWIDVMNEVAFITMDLEHRDRPDFAYRFLNAYLEITGDIKGLDLVRFYAANRALVRTKVSIIECGQKKNPGQKLVFPEQARSLMKLAESYTKPFSPTLYITHGFSGSGKTTATKKLIESLGAVRIRSDIERKRLFGLAAETSSSAQLKERMYGTKGNQRTYDKLKDLAGSLLKAKFTVIVDAAFLRQQARIEFHKIATQAGADFKILDFQAPEETLRRRIAERMKNKKDASEANQEVLSNQIRTQESLTEEETTHLFPHEL